MSEDDPGWGGCIGFLFSLALGVFLFYAVLGHLTPWLRYYDRVASACPTSGVATLTTHHTWGGVDWSVTCVNGDRWHISNGGTVKRDHD